MMDDSVTKAWDDLLNPEVLRPKLIAASIYITAFELLKITVIERLRSFYTHGFDEVGDEVISPEYTAAVLARNNSVLYASLDWLRDNDAINSQDLESFERVKNLRNRLAHGLLDVVGSTGLPPDFDECFAELVGVLRNIEVWWIAEVDIPTNPDFDGHEIDRHGIVPGPVMQVQLLLQVALGNEQKSQMYLREFRERYSPDA